MATPPIDLSQLPAQPGVYRFRDGEGRVLYIGRASELRRRVRSYWGSQRGRPRMRRMVPQVVAVELLVCASEHEASWLERNLLEASRPRFNRARGGMEVPLYLRLDDRPRTPGLTAHPQVGGALPHFGPYLGGTQVRLALSALARTHPLGYTGSAMGGSERAMAEIHGVGPGDRGRLAAELRALLEREPQAVAAARAALVARRSQAAAATEFELAGRLQEQLEAVEWLVATQRVTVHADGVPTYAPEALRGRGRDELIVAGWAPTGPRGDAGVLVELGLRHGRVRTWRQRPATADEAAPLLDATPESWQAFTGENAELAAGLHALHVG